MVDNKSNKHKNYRAKTLGNHTLHPETQMMGYGYDPMLSEGALKPPIFMTSTFTFASAQDGKEFFELAYGKREARAKEQPGLIYSRINNPDLEVLEDRLALWENADCAAAFASGMAAISTCLWSYLRPGDVIVYSAPIYGGTEHLIRNILPLYGIKSVEFEAGGPEPTLPIALDEAKALGRVAVIFTETPANPTNNLVDLEACANEAKRMEAETGTKPIVMVDNTFLGPVWQHPLEHGCDIVIYSLTKYVAGHSDVVAGAAVGSHEVMGPVRGFRTILGTMCDPHSGWLIMRSLETLKLRMTAAAENARIIAEYLRDHPKVSKVHYLGFLSEDDPCYRIFTEQAKSAGSTFSFDVIGGEREAFAVLDNLQIIKLAVSLGGTESLMEHPFTMTHSDVPDDVKIRLGIGENLVRISVGIENVDDLIADLEQALSAI